MKMYKHSNTAFDKYIPHKTSGIWHLERRGLQGESLEIDADLPITEFYSANPKT